MSQVERQKNPEIQPSKPARAGDISAELNHFMGGINDNDDQAVANAAAIAINVSAIVELNRGSREVSIMDLSLVADQTLDVGDGGVSLLTVTSGDKDFTVPEATAFGDRIQYILCDATTTETHWTLNTVNIEGFDAATSVPATAVVVLLSTGAANWTGFILSLDVEETYGMVNYTGSETISEVGTYDRVEFVLDGVTIDTQTTPGADWVTYDIDISAAAHGATLLRAKFINTAESNFTSRNYLVDHKHGFELMTIGGDVLSESAGNISYNNFYAIGSRAPLTP